MAMTMSPKWVDAATTDGVSSEDDAATLFFIVRTDAGETEIQVRAYAKGQLYASYESYDGLGLESFSIERTEAEDVWYVTADYASRASASTLPKLEVGETRYSIQSTRLGTQKATFSRGLVQEVSLAAQFNLTGTNAANIIGLSRKSDGSVGTTGIDVSAGGVTINIETVIDDATVTGGYLITAAYWAALNATNLNAWGGFAAGTLKLVDFGATPRSKETAAAEADWDLKWSLEFQPNITIPAFGGVGPINKNGHQILDVMYGRENINGITFGVPNRLAVHNHYQEVDFTTILLI